MANEWLWGGNGSRPVHFKGEFTWKARWDSKWKARDRSAFQCIGNNEKEDGKRKTPKRLHSARHMEATAAGSYRKRFHPHTYTQAQAQVYSNAVIYCLLLLFLFPLAVAINATTEDVEPESSEAFLIQSFVHLRSKTAEVTFFQWPEE